MKFMATGQYDSPYCGVEKIVEQACRLAARGEQCLGTTDYSTLLHGALMATPPDSWEAELLRFLGNHWFDMPYWIRDDRLAGPVKSWQQHLLENGSALSVGTVEQERKLCETWPDEGEAQTKNLLMHYGGSFVARARDRIEHPERQELKGIY